MACKSSGGHSWSLVATDYFRKWVEAIPTKNATSKVVIDFVMSNILTRFGCPERIVSDNEMSFRSEEYTDFYEKHRIQISYSSPYHPQGNGQAESSNKSSMKIIKRSLEKNKKALDSKLRLVVWADKVTVEKEISCSPFNLVYGIHARLPQNNLMEMYKFV